MLEKLLKLDEGKTIEFKENASSLDPIIHTIIAFAKSFPDYFSFMIILFQITGRIIFF